MLLTPVLIRDSRQLSAIRVSSTSDVAIEFRSAMRYIDVIESMPMLFAMSANPGIRDNNSRIAP